MATSHRSGSTVPAWADIKTAVTLALYVFVATFLTGFIAHGLDWDHLSNLTHAGEAAVAALLAALGFEGVAAVRRTGKRHDQPGPAL